jgi:hypothetical protein
MRAKNVSFIWPAVSPESALSPAYLPRDFLADFLLDFFPSFDESDFSLLLLFVLLEPPFPPFPPFPGLDFSWLVEAELLLVAFDSCRL